MNGVQPNLAARLGIFAKEIIVFCRTLPPDAITKPLLIQLVRSGTSIGANYAESQNGISRNDFRAKIYICKKEAQETLYWLEVLEAALPGHREQLGTLRTEAKELLKIFQTITNKLS